MSDGDFDSAVGRLHQSLAEMKKTDVWQQVVEPRDGVIARFQPQLKAEHIPALTDDEIRPFFYFEHNHHWSGLYRQVNRVCGDMDAFRKILLTLVDESQPIAARLDGVIGHITGLGKGILTGLLTIAHPEKYGVWNGTTEDGLVAISLYPDFARATSFGTKYDRINTILNRLSAALNIDLWTLDALWWHVLQSDEVPPTEIVTSPVMPLSEARFGLERHLHNFLLDNWQHTELGKCWAIYAEPGEPEAGYEYRCEVGRIDLLARHRTEQKWLVIELKRERASDQVVGQVLRYIGWVQTHLAEAGDTVDGLIISRSGDKALDYAVSAAPNLSFMTYEVEFRLSLSQLSKSGAAS